MVTSSSRTDDHPVNDLPGRFVEVSDSERVRRGVFVLGAPESGCHSVGSWLQSSGFAPALTDEGLRVEISEGRTTEPPTVLPTVWAEFLMAMADGSWELPPPGPILLSARSDLVPAFQERLRDAIDCSHGLPIVFCDELLLPILPVIGPATLQQFLGVLVLRNPVAIARTLSSKIDMSLAEGLSLWEHYMAAAFTVSKHLPTVVADIHQSADSAKLSAETIEALLSPSTSSERVLGYQSASPEPPTEFHWLDATEEEFLASGTRHQIEMWSCLTDAACGGLLGDFPASFEQPTDMAVEVLRDGARHRSARISRQEFARVVQEERAALTALSKKSDELLAAANATLSDTMTERDQLRSSVTDLMQRLRTMGVTQAEGHRKADRLAKENLELHGRLIELIANGEELERVYQSETWRIGSAITRPLRRMKQALLGTPRRSGG